MNVYEEIRFWDWAVNDEKWSATDLKQVLNGYKVTVTLSAFLFRGFFIFMPHTHTHSHPTHTYTLHTHTHTNLLQIEPLTFTYLQRNFFQEQATSLNLKGFFSKKILDEKKVGVALFDAHGETSRPAVWDKWNRQTHSSMQIEIWKTPLLLLKFYFKKS
jgi:hypothetical protein